MGGMKRKVGTFYTDFVVANHSHRDRAADVRHALVDSGSEATWIDAATLKKIGVTPEKKDVVLVMANGQEVTRQIGFAVIRVGAVHTIDEVVFALEGDMQLLGARSLEGLNLTIHPRKKTLAPAGPRLAAAGA